MFSADDRKVKQESTNWRDQRISNRHRKWGFDCPCVDLDFLVCEYHFGQPVALIEYKMHSVLGTGHEPNPSHPSYLALALLAESHHPPRGRKPLPCLFAFYWPKVWAFQVRTLNDAAKKWFFEDEQLSELEFVTRLHQIRNRSISREVAAALNRDRPPIQR